MPPIILSPTEIQQLAGGYKLPGKQLAELHRLGFFRARRSKVTGEVILERAHYDAVAAGLPGQQDQQAASRPKVRVPSLREPSHDQVRRASAACVRQRPVVLPGHTGGQDGHVNAINFAVTEEIHTR